MKCQNCGKNQANFHYSSNINGSVTETNLCAECAAQSGHGFQPASLFGGFFTGFFGEGNLPMPRLGLNTMSPFAVRPQMGILTQGCSCGQSCSCGENCSCDVSAPDVQEKRQGVDGEMQKRRELNAVREQMRIAAENEDFEKAAELRDQIKQIEGQQ